MHPLEPLSEAEIQQVLQVLRENGKILDTTRFVSVTLKEPPKDLVYEGKKTNREAKVISMDLKSNRARESVVSLQDRRILADSELPIGVQPAVILEEFDICVQIIKNSPDIWAKLDEHYGEGGWKKEDLVVDPWSFGYYGDLRPEEEGRRLLRPLCFFKDPTTKTPYAFPIEGLRPVVDLNERRVLRIDDYGKFPLPPAHFCAYEASQIQLRNDLKPLEVIQKEGPSFKVEGNRIRWEKWDLVVGFNAREGLTLHDVKVDSRPVLFRAGLSEMIVPYGDPAPQHCRQNAFDVGEYGVGMAANSLKLGCDCLGTIHYFHAHLCSGTGQPFTIKNAICLHEEDFGIAWKHLDRHADVSETRRTRRLVVSFITTLGNYDYGIYWYFYPNGNIELEAKLTGFVALGARHADAEMPKYGTLVRPQLYAPIHQHYFNFRLDFAVDGLRNTVKRVDVVPEEPGPDNPFANAHYAKRTPLKRELEARANLNLETSRTWDVSNPNVLNSIGYPVAYKLIPGENCFPRAPPEAWWRRRAGFVDYHVWVTCFEEREMFAAGDYPNQRPGGDGVKVWVEKDRPIENADVVLWYTMGVTHVPRPEDYPVMPVARAGFALKPNGFFDRNPAFDLAPQHLVNKNSCSVAT